MREPTGGATLFNRLAAFLAGEGHPDGADDVQRILDRLEYLTDRNSDAALLRQRIALLKAAARFIRVFQMTSADAPGVIFFGAEADPGIVDPGHDEHPPLSASGAGLSLRQAFESCIGEGVEYLSQFETRDEKLHRAPLHEGLASLDARSADMVVRMLQASTARVPDEIDWIAATQLSNARPALLPADLALRRAPGRAAVTPPFRLSCGCAAGPSFEAAAIHGLLELIERDAVSLWWRGGVRGRLVALEDESCAAATEQIARMRRGVGNRRTWLLDITTDLDVPGVVAISCNADGRGFACGLAARPTLRAAAQSALLEMSQMELAYAVVEARRREGGALMEDDQVHLARGTAIDVAQCALLHPVAPARRHPAAAAAPPAQQLAALVERLSAKGIETYAIDLTRPAFGIPVARIVAPCLQLEPCDVMTERLTAARNQTGGGETYTRGASLL